MSLNIRKLKSIFASSQNRELRVWTNTALTISVAYWFYGIASFWLWGRGGSSQPSLWWGCSQGARLGHIGLFVACFFGSIIVPILCRCRGYMMLAILSIFLTFLLFQWLGPIVAGTKELGC
ncbi:MAG TPA: hypothetical protein VEF76_12760 [Patescibacteria group bacterium]|nr:hypothetical protein [Patescibacteria group bacterium]